MSKTTAKRQPQPPITVRARLRPKAQLTVPEEIKQALRVREGDEIEFAVHEDGTVTVRGFVSVPTEHAWHFSVEGQAGKPQASDEIAAGGGAVQGSSEAMVAYINSLGSADT